MPPKKKPVAKSASVKSTKIVETSKKVAKKSKHEDESLEEVSFHEETVAKKTSSTMSIYEYTALIRFRCLQLGTPGAEPKIELNPECPEEYDPIVIATKEVNQCLVSLIIRRTLTDGTTEDWNPKDMIFPRM